MMFKDSMENMKPRCSTKYLETLVEVVDKCLKVILVSYRVLLKTISGESKNYIPYRLIDKPCIKVIIFFRSVTPGP